SFFDTANLTIATKDDRILNRFFYEQMPPELTPNICFHEPHIKNKHLFTETVNIFSFLEADKLSWATELHTKYNNENIQIRVINRDATNELSFCEYFPKNSMKSQGIKWVLDYLQLHDYQTMAFGDGVND